MKENIKIGLLALITITLGYQTYLISNKESKKDTHEHETHDHVTNQEFPNNSPLQITEDPSISRVEQPVKPNLPATTVKFAKNEHDFGKVNQDTKNEYIFEFTNTGKEPLVISSAKGSCGCTVPKYPKEPIPPGEKGKIEVVYSPGKQKGIQQKKVTLMANTDPAITELMIKADVQEVK